MVQRLTVNAIVMDSIPIRGNELYLFSRSTNKTKRNKQTTKKYYLTIIINKKKFSNKKYD